MCASFVTGVPCNMCTCLAHLLEVLEQHKFAYSVSVKAIHAYIHHNINMHARIFSRPKTHEWWDTITCVFGYIRACKRASTASESVRRVCAGMLCVCASSECWRDALCRFAGESIDINTYLYINTNIHIHTHTHIQHSQWAWSNALAYMRLSILVRVCINAQSYAYLLELCHVFVCVYAYTYPVPHLYIYILYIQKIIWKPCAEENEHANVTSCDSLIAKYTCLVSKYTCIVVVGNVHRCICKHAFLWWKHTC